MKNFIKMSYTDSLCHKCIAVADFETVVFDKIHYVIAIGFFFNSYKSWFINVSLNFILKENLKKFSFNLIFDFLSYLLSIRTRVFVYFHNFRSFDGILIIDYLIDNILLFNTNKIKVITRHGFIYQITLNNVVLRCSLNVLPKSLGNLSSAFFSIKKKIFNFNNFFFDNYYKKRFIILQYLKRDVILLFEILVKFRYVIYLSFGLDFINYLTVSSLSLKVYSSNFFKFGFCFYISDLFIYEYINKSYFGGLSEIFIPKGQDLYYYDINSLYPFIMNNNLMPIGKPVWVNPLMVNLDNFFGFLEVYLYVPVFLNSGVLPFRVNDKNIFSVGLVSGIVFSEELIFALSLGCKLIKIVSACAFRSGFIFDEFVGLLSYGRLTCKFTKNKVSEIIYKLVLNSLHGRFGIKNFFNEPSSVSLYNLKNKYYGCNSSYKINTFMNNVNKNNYKFNGAVQISAAIASLARIHILYYKYFLDYKNINIFYSDTDSVVVDRCLLLNMVSKNRLGFFKCIFGGLFGIFISPKIYYLENIKKNLIVKRFKGLLKNVSLKLIRRNFEFLYFSNSIDFNISYSIKVSIDSMKVFSSETFFFFKNFFFKRLKVWSKGFWVNTLPSFSVFYFSADLKS